jgi:hypothetical protein
MHNLLDMANTYGTNNIAELYEKHPYFVVTPTKMLAPCDSCYKSKPLAKIESSTHYANLCDTCLNTTPIVEWNTIATPNNNTSIMVLWFLMVLIIVWSILG